MNIIKSYREVVLISTIACILFVKCKPENDSRSSQIDEVRKSMKDFGDKSTEYRNFPIEVSFFDPEKEGDNPQLAIQRRKEFIKQSGLPDETNVVEFKKNNSITSAYDLYNNYITNNNGNPFLKTFEQYGAWLILTRLDLLAQNSENDALMTFKLVKNLAETNYEGFQLLSYSVNHLYKINFNSQKIRELGNTILTYAKNIKKIDNKQSTVIKKTQKPLPPEIIESLKNYNDNKEKNRVAAINQIEQILATL